jgi:hypothetical protein
MVPLGLRHVVYDLTLPHVELPGVFSWGLLLAGDLEL